VSATCLLKCSPPSARPSARLASQQPKPTRGSEETFAALAEPCCATVMMGSAHCGLLVESEPPPQKNLATMRHISILHNKIYEHELQPIVSVQFYFFNNKKIVYQIIFMKPVSALFKKYYFTLPM